jgi:hypothetical protein
MRRILRLLEFAKLLLVGAPLFWILMYGLERFCGASTRNAAEVTTSRGIGILGFGLGGVLGLEWADAVPSVGWVAFFIWTGVFVAFWWFSEDLARYLFRKRER